MYPLKNLIRNRPFGNIETRFGLLSGSTISRSLVVGLRQRRIVFCSVDENRFRLGQLGGSFLMESIVVFRLQIPCEGIGIRDHSTLIS